MAQVDDLTCGLTAYTPGSAPGSTLGNEYGKPLLFNVICRCPIEGEDNVGDLCCHLEEQVRALHKRVCEALERKYSSVLRCDDHTANLSSDVITEFALVRPVFEHLEKVRLFLYVTVVAKRHCRLSHCPFVCSLIRSAIVNTISHEWLEQFR